MKFEQISNALDTTLKKIQLFEAAKIQHDNEESYDDWASRNCINSMLENKKNRAVWTAHPKPYWEEKNAPYLFRTIQQQRNTENRTYFLERFKKLEHDEADNWIWEGAANTIVACFDALQGLTDKQGVSLVKEGD